VSGGAITVRVDPNDVLTLAEALTGQITDTLIDIHHAVLDLQKRSEANLRDQFAMHAIDGFNKRMTDYGWDDEILAAHAKEAYRIADAMMKARLA
jgi:hypothetical protein